MMDCCGCGWHLHALRFCSPKGVKIPSQEREVFGLLLQSGMEAGHLLEFPVLAFLEVHSVHSL